MRSIIAVPLCALSLYGQDLMHSKFRVLQSETRNAIDYHLYLPEAPEVSAHFRDCKKDGTLDRVQLCDDGVCTTYNLWERAPARPRKWLRAGLEVDRNSGDGALLVQFYEFALRMHYGTIARAD